MQKEHQPSSRKHASETKLFGKVSKTSHTKRTECHEEKSEISKFKRLSNLEAGDQLTSEGTNMLTRTLGRLKKREESDRRDRRKEQHSETLKKGRNEPASSRRPLVEKEHQSKNEYALKQATRRTNLHMDTDGMGKKDPHYAPSNGSDSAVVVKRSEFSSENVSSLGKQARSYIYHDTQKNSKAERRTRDKPPRNHYVRTNANGEPLSTTTKNNRLTVQKLSSIMEPALQPSPLGSGNEEYGSDFEQSDHSVCRSTTSAETEDRKSAGSYPGSPTDITGHGCLSVVTSESCSFVAAATNVGLRNSGDTQTINFTHSLRAGERQIRQRLAQRAKDLFRLIELDFDGSGHLFELKPVDEYSSYMLRFGRANRSQVYVQTNDDALDREIQTDRIDICKHGGVWTQWPVFGADECFGHRTSADEDAYFRIRGEASGEELDPITKLISDVVKEFSSRQHGPTETQSSVTDKERQSHFAALPHGVLPTLRYAIKLLDEEDRLNSELMASSIKDDLLRDQPAVSALKLQPGTLEEKSCVACYFCSGNGDRLLTIHQFNRQPPSLPPDDLPGFIRLAGEAICIWSIGTGVGRLEHKLYCPGLSEAGSKGANINCAVFSPDTEASMVIGGLVDGSVCVWDLNESSWDPPDVTQNPSDSNGMYLKPPLYSTCAMEGQQPNSDIPVHKTADRPNYGIENCVSDKGNSRHFAPIVDLQLTHCAEDLSVESSFQFVTLDAVGGISLWMVVKNVQNVARNIYEMMAGSQVDLGLRPSNRVLQLTQLLFILPGVPRLKPSNLTWTIGTNDEHSTGLETMIKSPVQNQGVFATVLGVTAAGNFLVGFTDGSLTQLARSSRCPVYPGQFARPRNRACLFSLAVNPDRSTGLVVAGYADGFIRLYQLTSPCALQQLSLSVCHMEVLAVIQLHWFNSNPTVFLSLDTSGRLAVWDVSKETQDHVFQLNVLNDASKINCFSLNSKIHVNLKGRLQPVTVFALVCSDCVQLHWLPPEWLNSHIQMDSSPNSIKQC